MRVLSIISKLFTFFNTLLLKKKFKKFGKGSRIKWGSRILNPHNIEIGDNVLIEEFVWLNAGENNCSLKILDGTHISRFSHINCYNDVQIGSHVLIGENVYIGDADHSYKNKSQPIIKQQIDIKKKVLIDSGSHICKNAVISSGISVGKNSIVGPNVFLTLNLPDYSIAVGNTATIISQNE